MHAARFYGACRAGLCVPCDSRFSITPRTDVLILLHFSLLAVAGRKTGKGNETGQALRHDAAAAEATPRRAPPLRRCGSMPPRTTASFRAPATCLVTLPPPRNPPAPGHRSVPARRLLPPRRPPAPRPRRPRARHKPRATTQRLPPQHPPRLLFPSRLLPCRGAPPVR